MINNWKNMMSCYNYIQLPMAVLEEAGSGAFRISSRIAQQDNKEEDEQGDRESAASSATLLWHCCCCCCCCGWTLGDCSLSVVDSWLLFCGWVIFVKLFPFFFLAELFPSVWKGAKKNVSDNIFVGKFKMEMLNCRSLFDTALETNRRRPGHFV